jgi:DNA-binding NarL/FixJ family response regulator
MDGRGSWTDGANVEGEVCDACSTEPAPALVRFAIGHRLTARELQVARCVAQGSSNQQIADHLYLSVRTVEGHLQRCYEKLGVNSRVRLALRIHAASAAK